jgi:hypothetical protein
MAGTDWYLRMADIPKLAFTGSPGVARERLPGARLKPAKAEHGSLMWSTPGGMTSASPVQTHGEAGLQGMALPELVRHTWEALELPGTPMDYHFALQNTVEGLWRRRRAEPSALAELEMFARLDIDLAEADPRAVSFVDAGAPDGGWTFVRMLTFGRLMTLYEREGAHREALDLARRGERLGQTCNLDELARKVAALDAEGSA